MAFSLNNALDTASGYMNLMVTSISLFWQHVFMIVFGLVSGALVKSLYQPSKEFFEFLILDDLPLPLMVSHFCFQMRLKDEKIIAY